MNVVVILEHRFDRTPDGAIWTQTAFSYPFWTRYLAVYERVNVVARVRNVPTVPGDYVRADGDAVSFIPVPYYVGPLRFIKQAWRIMAMAQSILKPGDAIIMRVGSYIAACIEPRIRKVGYPYGVEVVGDPYDTFSPGAVMHPLRAFFRWLSPRQLRRQCMNACAAAYVTAAALQRRYPVRPGAFTTHYSSIQLLSEAYASQPRVFSTEPRTFTLVTVGTLAQMYKGYDTLLAAMQVCVAQGADLQLRIVGDGQFRQELETRTRELNLDGRVQFLGQLLGGMAVREQLDQADLFVLPSRQEGLPRAMIEAMARALPCIGSTVGGIPELLPDEDMIPPGDAAALASKIVEVTSSPARMTGMSARNLAIAGEYHEDILNERRVTFYRYIKERTAEWLKGQKAL